MAEIKALFYLHMASNSNDCPRLIFLDYPLYETGAGNDEESIAQALCILLGLADATATAAHALYALRSELGWTLCAANALGHKDEAHGVWHLQKFLIVDIIAQPHTHVFNYGIIGTKDPEERRYHILKEHNAQKHVPGSEEIARLEGIENEHGYYYGQYQDQYGQEYYGFSYKVKQLVYVLRKHDSNPENPNAYKSVAYNLLPAGRRKFFIPAKSEHLHLRLYEI
jgi:hypothetical protein